jgi:hypothetical protein
MLELRIYSVLQSGNLNIRPVQIAFALFAIPYKLAIGSLQAVVAGLQSIELFCTYTTAEK